MIITEPISNIIWDTKYRYRLHDQIIDKSVEDTWERVAKAIAKAEKVRHRFHWQRAFRRILEDYQFLPGGRILAGAGTKHKVTLLNCFVMNIAKDSLPGIFNALQEGAMTLQQGGGIGYDFSVLRPNGDIAKKIDLPSSGPVSFMKIWDTTCSVLLSTGARRGAMMGVLRVDHPDIEEFITAKQHARELRHFNVSVMVSDAFMRAVKEDAEWALVFPIVGDIPNNVEISYRQWGNSIEMVPCKIYKRIRARELWEKIIRSAYDYAEPGVLFADTINSLNTLWYREHISATNPCGEIPLPAYGACDLGAINLTKFVEAPFTEHAKIKWTELEETVRIATRFLDNVIDVSNYPLPAQKQQAHGTRRIGLGITGLADLFVMLGHKYGSDSSVDIAKEIMRKVAFATWDTSIELADEKSPFPFYKEDYLKGAFVANLPEALQKKLAAKGVRNSHHNTIAPAGTISLFANNISNGIEPIFAPKYSRNVLTMHNEKLTFDVKDYAYHLWLHQNNEAKLPPAWTDVNELFPEAHLKIQAIVQPFIDNAISKTINIPKDFPFARLMDVYSLAFSLSLKGCTIFRPNPVTGSVLEVKEETQPLVDQCCQRD